MAKQFKKVDIEKILTDRIVKLIESEGVNWIKPWTNTARAGGAPCNALTGHEYSGVNFIQTLCEAFDKGYTDNRWLTFKQIASLGGSVKGEKGTRIVFWKPITVKDRDNPEQLKSIPFLSCSTIFNVCQVTGLPEKYQPGVKKEIAEPTFDASDVDTYLRAAGAEIRHGGNRAYYSPSDDYIRLPEHGQFKARAGYAATAFHEAGHWTGHKSRLGRKFGASFGDAIYAKEELVAELTSCFLCAEWNCDAELQHAGYLSSWLKALKADKSLIVKAASQASKAARYIRDAANESALAVAAE